jgi:hypothetical protein
MRGQRANYVGAFVNPKAKRVRSHTLRYDGVRGESSIPVPLAPPQEFRHSSIEPNNSAKIPIFSRVLFARRIGKGARRRFHAPGERVFLQELYTIPKRYSFRNAQPSRTFGLVGQRHFESLSDNRHQMRFHPCAALAAFTHRAYSGNPAFRRPSINSFEFACPPRAIQADIVKAGSSSSRRAAASRASASRPRWAKADARHR